MKTITRTPTIAAVLFSANMLAGCATNRTPQFSYDASVPSLPTVQAAAADNTPQPLHVPPAWTVARGGTAAGTPTGRVENANAAARVEPRREGYYNAIQIYPWSEGALYQVYAAVGQITTIALEPGESLTGAGPIAAGDTARWVIGDTESGSGANRRVHILVKPTRPDISTNLVVTTDRRTYMIELRARESLYMPAVAWAYPALQQGSRQTVAGGADHPGRGCSELSLWLAGAGRQPAMAAGFRLRRWTPRLCRLSGRDRAGRDAADLRARLRWRAADRQFPHPSKRPDRGPPVRRGRAAPWQRQPPAGRQDRPHRAETGRTQPASVTGGSPS
ncbi:TrbG/VirB9 family P-type conjugative transfer protein [Paracoccus mutanolyticus]